ncbi:hypothetical protein [Kineococcus rubinsiae]|uniref:hypothetical protein n=1 Tax=Kineococcus rubinsiae TaxID=2609562 RepID=UPI00142FFBCF|nr:hypothetical protein [Kineococcus rubinsiae]NIZ91706.1 hypothetical protein [Kineococcus rubinsiae]
MGGDELGAGVQALAGDLARASWQARGAASRLTGLGHLEWHSPSAARFAARLGAEVRAVAAVVARCEDAQAALQAHARVLQSTALQSTAVRAG